MPVSKKLKKYIGLAGILFLFPLLWLVFFGDRHNGLTEGVVQFLYGKAFVKSDKYEVKNKQSVG